MRTEPFVWGTHDCAIGLVAKVTKALTGVDYTEPFLGKYNDLPSAYKLVRRKKFKTLGDLISSILPEIPPSFAQIGDIVAIETDSPLKHALGVVNGERIFVLRDDGIGTVDFSEAKRAFKVG